MLYTPLNWLHATWNVDTAVTVAVHRPYANQFRDRCGAGNDDHPEGGFHAAMRGTSGG